MPGRRGRGSPIGHVDAAADHEAPRGRLPFFFGWIIVASGFVTMAVGVNARTAFSLLFPPIVDEFGWDRGVVAGAFSFGFLVSAVLSPFVGRLMDRKGPRFVVEIGVAAHCAGLLLAPLSREPWQLYLTLGLLVGAGANFLGYRVHSQFLPNWFVRRRGLAIGIAFSGVGVGVDRAAALAAVVILHDGWRTACWVLALITLVVLVPLNLLLRRRPQEIGLQPDGDAAPTRRRRGETRAQHRRPGLGRDRMDARARAAHRAVLVDRARLIPRGFTPGTPCRSTRPSTWSRSASRPSEAACALGLVSLLGVPGQIIFGACVGPDRARMGLGDRLRGLRHLLRWR